MRSVQGIEEAAGSQSRDSAVGIAANMIGVRKRIIACEKDENRIKFVNEHYPDVLTAAIARKR